ncbi:transglutaminase-like cysteine peptidase [Tardiphaga sp. 709]|nr:transglutaminase-like cysteine peptidase [Tardiphaga sp. 709]WNV07126.1 transglutaminase-like cysteine peptidase [Tardiphaga sp. 709]
MMWTSAFARVRCASVLALGLAIFAAPTDLTAGTAFPDQAISAVDRPAEPFGLSTSALPEGELKAKWRGVEREQDDEQLALELCAETPVRCSPEAAKFLDIVGDASARDGRARMGEVNRAINLAVRPGDDLVLYGATDVWRSPLALFATGAGDCEDYAIAKFTALRAAGVAAEDLRVVILRDTLRQEDHAVAAARLDGRWFMLDNRRMAMVEDVNMKNTRPLFVMDQNGIRQYVDAPLLAATQRSVADEAALTTLASSAKKTSGRPAL